MKRTLRFFNARSFSFFDKWIEKPIYAPFRPFKFTSPSEFKPIFELDVKKYYNEKSSLLRNAVYSIISESMFVTLYLTNSTVLGPLPELSLFIFSIGCFLYFLNTKIQMKKVFTKIEITKNFEKIQISFLKPKFYKKTSDFQQTAIILEQKMVKEIKFDERLAFLKVKGVEMSNLFPQVHIVFDSEKDNKLGVILTEYNLLGGYTDYLIELAKGNQINFKN